VPNRRLGLFAYVAAALLAFARVYIGAHYPWDVLAGLAFGASVTLLGWLLLRHPRTASPSWLRHQPGLKELFAEPDGPAHAPAHTGGIRLRP
jgi:undecaprenyl-diphosphatase